MVKLFTASAYFFTNPNNATVKKLFLSDSQMKKCGEFKVMQLFSLKKVYQNSAYFFKM